jgi:proteasome lid subunit RPN8/RPN11
VAEERPSPDELEIEIHAQGEGDLPEGEDPALREGRHLLPLGRPTQDPRWVLGYACLKQMLAHGQRNGDCEVGGVLLGEIWRCPRGRVTEARESLPAQHTEAGLGHVTFSHDSWQEIYEYMEQVAPELRLVGWYHTHPSFGVFFSGQDRFIQKNFFSGAGQVGVVVDPLREDVAAFQCLDGEVEELSGLWIGVSEDGAAAARKLLERLTFRGGEHAGKGALQRLVDAVLPQREAK